VPQANHPRCESRRSIVRWAGSKRLLLPELHRHIPATWNRYFEPFVGSGCLFFSLDRPPKNSVLGDINGDLIQTYEQLSRHPVVLYWIVASIPVDSSFYYDLRGIQPQQLTSLERAARFIYLNRFAFNGVYRVNRAGEFNVPRGKSTGAIPSLSEFRYCAKRLRSATLRTGDFEAVLGDASRDDFVYLDPPYAKAGIPRYGEYGYNAFSESDIGRFVKAVKAASDRGAKLLISYAEADGIRSHLRSWNHRRVLVRRNVAGFLANRRRVAEMLLTNY
jgi:DNA adenine methylase